MITRFRNVCIPFYFLTFFASFLVLSYCDAQTGFHVGGVGGINSTYIINQQTWGKHLLDYKVTIRNAHGFVFGFNFNNNVGFQTELRFAELGQKYYSNNGNKEIEREIHIKQMQVPFLLKINGSKKKRRTYVLIGPIYGFRQEFVETGSRNYLFKTPDVVTHKFNKRDTQVMIEIGNDIIFLKHIMLNVGLRGATSVYDINHMDWKIKGKNGKYKPSLNAFTGVSFGLQYIIPIRL